MQYSVNMKVYFAPIQGFTDDVYRKSHRRVYGDVVDEYVTPFVRREHGEIRSKDWRDAVSAINEANTVVQVIVKNVEEFHFLVKPLVDAGCKRIDINAGCPYPMQTAKGRGCGLPAHIEEFSSIMTAIGSYADIKFSLKMRLGMVDPTQWRTLLPIINDANLCCVTVHPRVAKQLYKGDLFMDEFSEIYHSVHHPLVYNGDLATVDDVNRVMTQYPLLQGVMIGRGLLSRPSLVNELKDGTLWDDKQRLQAVLKQHDLMLEEYSARLQGGEHQLLMKMKTTWEYLQPFIGRKQWKAIHKSTSMSKYRAAVQAITLPDNLE